MNHDDDVGLIISLMPPRVGSLFSICSLIGLATEQRKGARLVNDGHRSAIEMDGTCRLPHENRDPLTGKGRLPKTYFLFVEMRILNLFLLI